MRRMMRRRSTDRNKTFVYVCALLAIVVYGLPRLPALQPGLPGTFSTVWILFAGLALSSNLYFLFGADKERSRMLETYEWKNRKLEDTRLQESERVRRQSL